MNIKKATIAAAVSAIIGLGATSQAAASVYSHSYLDLSNFTIFLSDDGGVTPGGGTIDNFNFDLTNTARLNGSPVISVANCNGTPGVNDCGTAPTLNASAVNAPLGTVTRGENAFNFFGPGTDQYANADSIIHTAQLTDGTPSHVEQIAEAELQTGTSAGSSAEMISTSGFTFAFAIAGANFIQLDFDADWSKEASINDPLALAATAEGNMKVTFELTEDNTGDFVRWTPDGNIGTGCVSSFGVCSEVNDDGELNADVGVTTDGATDALSGTADDFTMQFAGLYDGDWTLTLNTLTSTAVSRTVPEPGMLALLGIGLLGLGATRRRRNKA